jgi:RNA polymerase sigma-70 factor (ECF subfamily)
LEAQLIEKLIYGIAHGDEECFRTLYDMYKNKVYNTAKRLTNDDKAAEDIMQEVFVIIYTKIYKLKHAEAFEVWLYRIVINCCKNSYKKSKNLLVVEDKTIETAAGESCNETPSESLIRKERNEEMMNCISKLSEKLKTCIILYYFNEMSIREIAETLECSEGTVKSRLFKGKKALEKSFVLKMEGEVKEYGYR